MGALVEARKRTKAFPGTIALNAVNFDLQPAEIHAIVGENGAGKSTLMLLMAGVYQPDFGEFVIEDFRNSLQVTLAAFTLERFFFYPLVKGDDNLDFVGAYFIRYIGAGAAEFVGGIADQPVGGCRTGQTEDILPDAAERLGRGRIEPGFPGDIFVTGELLEPFVKTIDLGLGEPVALVFDLKGLDTGIPQQVVDLDIAVTVLDKLDIIVRDPAAV